MWEANEGAAERFEGGMNESGGWGINLVSVLFLENWGVSRFVFHCCSLLIGESPPLTDRRPSLTYRSRSSSKSDGWKRASWLLIGGWESCFDRVGFLPDRMKALLLAHWSIATSRGSMPLSN